MRMRMAALVVLLLSSSAFACKYDSDCADGSRCEKADGSRYGYCVGGRKPGNKYDKKPSRRYGDLSGKEGNTCKSDLQCGMGNTCHKEDGELRGVCVDGN